MTATISIKDIASIRTGYSFRKGELQEGKKRALGLQISDLRENRIIHPENLSPIQWEGTGPSSLLKPGEVVLAAKGNHNRAAVYNDVNSEVVPSSQFLILTIAKTGQILPEFLCWTLNYSATQQKLTELQGGTSIPSISKSALSSLPIPLPPMATQEKILRVQSLWEEEQALIDALNINREKMLRGMFQKLIRGE